MKKIVVTFVLVFTSFASFADISLTGSFKNCIRESEIVKLYQDGSKMAPMVGLKCDNAAAENLYNNIVPFTNERIEVWSNGEKIASRSIPGVNEYRTLRCYKNMKNSYSWCIFMFNISDNFTRALDL